MRHVSTEDPLRAMLAELSITNFAIIDQTRIQFQPGFNAITGETGAGKSILIDALGAVLGDRIGSDVVRTGARSATIEAIFDVDDLPAESPIALALADLGIDVDDGQVILSREIVASGRSVARINGRAANAGALATVGQHLVDIHGQSDHVSLLRPAEQLDMLDRYARTMPLRQRVAEQVARLRAIERRIADLTTNARERAQRADFLRFQVTEIREADLRPGEDDELNSERALLMNAERVFEDIRQIQATISGSDDFGGGDPEPSALAILRLATAAMADLRGIDPAAGDLSDRLEEVVVLLQDLASDVRSYEETIDADPGRLLVVEERLELIRSLKRKYGATIDEVLAEADRAERELSGLTGDDADVEHLRAEAEGLRSSLAIELAELSSSRACAGADLATKIERAMVDLNMGRAKFAVRVEQIPRDSGIVLGGTDQPVAFDQTGADRVTFLLAPNAGEALKPVARVASGGETSRLMLALKSILSDVDDIPTLVFDEVDVGVGGRSGQVVGEKLWGLVDAHQVIVITHLPQIAAFADTHFRIAKQDQSGRIVSDVTPVDDDARIDELAEMLDGLPVTEASRANARTMLERVERWKVGRGHRVG